ncbi:unnamed protein product [Urochloa humidicola]
MLTTNPTSSSPCFPQWRLARTTDQIKSKFHANEVFFRLFSCLQQFLQMRCYLWSLRRCCQQVTTSMRIISPYCIKIILRTTTINKPSVCLSSAD